MKTPSNIYLLILILLLVTGCQPQSPEENDHIEEVYEVRVPEWTKDKNIYQVDISQYTPEGTFAAFEKEIPRLKEMGVDILWLMPIFEISEKYRKENLDSYYSIKDFKAINPELGTKEDFSRLVEAIHISDMFILIDWVANHTSRDHEWTKTHPEFYTKDQEGNFMPPAGTDWDDVVDLNYGVAGVHEAMTDAMMYWVKEFSVDGFRCDLAEWVPMDFWTSVRRELDKVRQVFMLAEGENPDLHAAFDMTYASDLHHTLIDVANQNKEVSRLDSIIKSAENQFPSDAYRLNFLTHHKDNTSKDTIDLLLGPAHEAMAVFIYTAPGMPLVFSEQESNIRQRMEFFEKDTIHGGDYGKADFYRSLNNLKHQNEALWNGDFGGEYTKLGVSNAKEVYAYKRIKDKSMVITVLNLSDKTHHYNMIDAMEGMIPYFRQENVPTEVGSAIEIRPWGYQVFTK